MLCKADLNTGDIVPDDFAKKLEEHYRDYYDMDGNLIEGRQENLDAFFYFVDRILSSVNAEFTKFGPDKRKRRRTAFLRQVFTPSDEAFGLLLVENYESRWRAQAADGQIKGEWRKEKKYQAKYTSSNHGLKNVTWDEAGIESYNKKLEMIVGLRAGEGCTILEQKLQDRFRDAGDQHTHDVESDSDDDRRKSGEGGKRKTVEAYLDLGLIDIGLVGMMESV